MRRNNKFTIFASLLLAMLLTYGSWGLASAFAAQSPQIPLAANAIPQFVDPLPTLSIAPQNSTMATLIGSRPLTLTMCEFKANVLPTGTFAPGVKPETWVWGYIPGGTCPTATQDTYIGPVIVNTRGIPTEVTYVNNLGYANTTNVLAYKYSTDQTIHWADPLADWTMANMCMMNGIPGFGTACAQNYAGPVAAVAHLHGAEAPPEIDGSPDSWFTSDGNYRGHKYYSSGAPGNSAIYKYPNTQQAAPIWFHDHTLGATRLNVYAGLAGAYYIQDPNLNLPSNLQPLTEVVPVVLQDRMFDTSGQLFFPADSAGGVLYALNPDHPYWVPEFVGDTIVINGKAWPYVNVQPKRYRFLFLNGSNARTYEMFLVTQPQGNNGPPLWVISTDGGYLDTPVKIDPTRGQKLLMQPGERYEVIIDFAKYAGTNLIIRNTGRTPYPGGASPQGSTLGRIMQFRVAKGRVTDTSYDPASGKPLRTGSQSIVRLVNPATGTLAVTAKKTRQLTLNEVALPPSTAIDPVTGALTNYPGGPVEILVNNSKWAGTNRSDFTPLTVNGVTTYFSELPQEGDTEVWEIVNTTADAHPIHLHLVQFQLINRQNYNASKYLAVYGATFPGGVYLPAFGPPLNYSTGNARALGGNPDVTPYLQNGIMPPLPNEAGWKDTVMMLPGQVTRIAVRYAPTDLPTTTAASMLYFPFDPNAGSLFNYVWHCHIIDHEDNEMMRPSSVKLNPLAPPPAARPLVKGINY
jgi:FtsP/CotA-like multicopper oxidase with cupredoxin domain